MKCLKDSSLVQECETKSNISTVSSLLDVVEKTVKRNVKRIEVTVDSKELDRFTLFNFGDVTSAKANDWEEYDVVFVVLDLAFGECEMRIAFDFEVGIFTIAYNRDTKKMENKQFEQFLEEIVQQKQ